MEQNVNNSKKNIANRLMSIMIKDGASVSSVVILGSFVHVDFTKRNDEQKIREVLQVMNPSRIDFKIPSNDGKHLDGSRNHRIVAIF